MNSENLWKPSKFIKKGNIFAATDDINELSTSYRLIADIQAFHYYELVRHYCKGDLLDLACGKAPMYEMYKPFVKSIFCTGWDGSYHDVTFSDSNFDLNNSFPLESDQFDTIILTDVLEHISNPMKLWSEMFRVLRPGGHVIIGVPFIHLIHDEPVDFYRYTEFMLRKFASDNKFKVLTIFPYGGSIEVLLDIISKHFGFSELLSKIFYRLSRAYTFSKLGNRVYKKTSSKYPLGYCMVVEK